MTPPRRRRCVSQPQSHWNTVAVRQAAQAERLVQPGHELVRRLLYQGGARRQGRFAHALQVAPAVAQVGKLGHRLPGQPFLHTLGQQAGGWQGPVHQQFLGPVALPGHVRRDEFGHKALTVHLQGRSRLAPQVLELLQKGVPGQRRRDQRIDGPRHGRADGIEIGTRPEEARPVRGILHRVGEGNQFFVVIEGAGPALRHHLGAQGGVAGSQQDLPVALAAGRTGAVVPGKGGVAAGAAARAGGAKDRHQFVMAAGLAGARVGLHIATGAAHVLGHPGDVGLRPLGARIQAHGLTAPAEPGVVDLVQAGGQLVAGRRQA